MEKKKLRKNSKKKNRCGENFGVSKYLNSEKYVIYHDKRWCKPEHNDQELFAMLILESFAAGLSWNLILEKEEALREAFDNFNPKIICNYNEDKIEELMENENIIRNKKKIEAAINNANKFLNVQKEFGSFDKYIWGFTNEKIIDHHLENIKDMPSKNELSEKISKDLKKRGFQFIGAITIYSYLQGIGIINDHWEHFDYR